MEIRRAGRDGVVDCEEVQLALSCRMSFTGGSTTRIRLWRGDWRCVTSGGFSKIGCPKLVAKLRCISDDNPFTGNEIVMAKLMFSILFLLFAVTLGCLPSPSADNSSAKPKPSTTPGVTAAEATPRETIGKTTQNVMVLTEALQKGGVLADKNATTSNPLLASAAAYRNSVATIGAMAVDKAIQIRNAQSIRDPKPLTHEEFMQEIIKKGRGDGIWLPMLPYYQEYAWDEKTQKLVVVDFPARKEERAKQR